MATSLTVRKVLSYLAAICISVAFGYLVREGVGALARAVLDTTKPALLSVVILLGAWALTKDAYALACMVLCWGATKPKRVEADPLPTSDVAVVQARVTVLPEGKPSEWTEEQWDELRHQARVALHTRIIDAAVDRGEVIRVQ